MTKHKFVQNIDMPSKKQLEKAVRPFSDEELELTPDVKGKVEKLINFFENAGINYDKFEPESTPKIDFSKRKAYPNQDVYMSIPGHHNTDKWLQAIKEIYYKEKSGDTRVDAIRRITSGWNIMETHDFLNWLKFHEAGEHMKYKFAKVWYESPDVPNYAFPFVPQNSNTEDKAPARDFDFTKNQVGIDSEKKQIIERQRNKIIGRLDSAEKLLRSPDGQIFSGKDFEALLETVYQLKKKIQLVNKVSTNTRLYEDMIVREANILHRSGFIKAANALYAVAQTPAQSGESATGSPNAKGVPTPTSPPAPTTPQGAPGGLPSTGPGMPQGAPSDAAPEGIENQPLGIKEFMKGMSNPEDKSEDHLEVDDADNELLVTEAQLASHPELDEDIPITDSPAPAPLNKATVAPPKAKAIPSKFKPSAVDLDEPLEVSEDDLKPKDESDAPVYSDFNNKMDAVFSNVTIDDIVAKLEELAKFYKTREAPRQLGIVDMMLDSLGLASYFPSLAEATNKSLESNNYISTRVEDILSKLRGAISSKNIDLKPKEVDRPEVAGIKNKLKSDEEKEKNRKQIRKEQEAAELSSIEKETPEIEIDEDLSAPPPLTKTPVAPARPVTPLV